MRTARQLIVRSALAVVVALTTTGHLWPGASRFDDDESQEAVLAQSGAQEIRFDSPALPGVHGPVLQALENIPAQPFTLPTLESRTVSELMAEQAASDVIARDRREPVLRREFEIPGQRQLPQNPNAPALSQWPPPTAADVPATLASPPPVASSFDGPDFTESLFFPPDSMGDVGPTQYIVTVNGRIRTYSKTTLAADGVLDVTANTFFNPVRNGVTAVDPRIRFDRHSNRWFIVYFTVAVPSRLVIAFSDTATITASTVWQMTFFTDTVVNGSGHPCLSDYETLGIDANALYIGANEFCGTTTQTMSYFGSTLYVLAKPNLLAGAGIIAGFVSTSTYVTPQGVDNYDASPAFGYFVSVDRLMFGRLLLTRVSDPASASPSVTTNAITVLSTTQAVSVPHSGGTKRLDGLDHRLINAVARNGRIWTAHAFCVNTAGVADIGGGCNSNGVRWYELSNISADTPTVNQAGTIFDPAVSNPRYYWFPSVNINAQGTVVIGFASAAANTFAGAAFAHREPSDPPGTTQAPIQHLAGVGPYNNTFETTSTYRWGDYSMVSVDPSDDATFWTIQEYAKGGSTWGTKVTRLEGSSVSGLTISDVANQTTTLNTPLGPIDFIVTDSNTPAASLTLSASSSNPALVPVSNIVFGGAEELRTFTITPAANQSGTTTITITVSNGSQTASDTFELTVTPVNTAPTITDVDDQDVAEDSTIGPLAFTVGDAETPAGSLAVTATSPNTFLVPPGSFTVGGTGANRTLTITPAANRSGVATITLSVSDGVLTTHDTFWLTVTPVNDAPTITDVSNLTVAEDQVLGPIVITVNDLESAPATLTVTASSSNSSLLPPGGLVLGGTGSIRTLTATPAANQSGTTTITLTVDDGALSTSDTFELTFLPVNDAPAIENVTDRTIAEDSVLGPLSFTISDLETTAASLNVTALSSNGALVPPTGLTLGGTGAARTLTVTPVAHESGTTIITLNVSDGALTASDTLTLTVTPVNDAPTIADLPNQTIAEDQILGPLAFAVGDVESAAGTLSVTVSSSNVALVPPGAVVAGGTGANRTLMVTPMANESGTTTITVTVSDGSASASDTFVLTVAPVDDAPIIAAIADQSVEQDGIVGPFPLVIADIDSPPGSIDVAASASNATLLPPAGVVLAGTGFSRTLSLQPAAGQFGSTTVTVSVSDGLASTATTFTLAVTSATGPPGAPTNFLATLAGPTLSMSWGLPASGAPPTDYTIQAAIDPNFTAVVVDQSTGSAARTLTVPNVPTGIFYLRVRARNGLGTGPASNVQRIGGPPDPPTAFVATLNGTTLSMTWAAPASGPSPTDYVLEAAFDVSFNAVIYSQRTGSPLTSLVIPGVPPGTFFLRARARNAAGQSAPSNVQVIGGGGLCTAAPGSATAFTITKLGGLNVRLSWTAPEGGANPATDYLVQAALDAGFSRPVLNQPVGRSVTTFDAVAPPGMFFVRIVSANVCGTGAPSNVVSLTMP